MIVSVAAAVANLALVCAAPGCGEQDDEVPTTSGEAPGKKTDGSGPGDGADSTRPAQGRDAGSARETDSPSKRTIGKKYGDDVHLGDLSVEAQKQYCIDVKRVFAPVQEDALKALCTRVAAGRTRTPEACAAERDKCVAQHLTYATDPGCDEKVLWCPQPKLVSVNKLSTCFLDLAKSFESYAANHNTCEPMKEKDIEPPPSCEEWDVDVKCSGMVEQVIRGDGVW